MKLKRYVTLFIILVGSYLNAQVASDYAVLLSSTVDAVSPSVTLNWPIYPTATSYNIYKKTKTNTVWGTAIATLDGGATNFTDTDVIIDSFYEYQVERFSSIGIVGTGYLCAGIQMKVTDFRGACLIVVDTTIISPESQDFYQFKKDISGDSWQVEELHVARAMTPDSIRNLIINASSEIANLTSVVLLGRVPVLYSGNIYPDGHPDHQGAWPADGIYGDIDVDYTDATVNNIVASRPENQNIPGDGKYDQSVFKSKIELEIGRIDFYNLPGLGISEDTLLINYLQNNHNFRTGITNFEERGLIDDNFGAFAGEAFASAGWKNFAPLVGNNAILEADYFSTMLNDSYLWSYGCGGGWFQGAGGVGTSYDFMIDTVKTVFTMLFGSYFGDWDSYDNFLRSSLASGATLTACWSGRPHWQFHHMALGDNIGYSARLSQNNAGTYKANIFAKNVHIGLLGDPTLRMHIIKPVINVSVSKNIAQLNAIDIAYENSPEPDIDGYLVYRSSTEFGKFERLTPEVINYSPFIDEMPLTDLNFYMVKAVKLTTSPSGSYYNTSTGISDSITFEPTVAILNSILQIKCYPNPASTELVVQVSAQEINQPYYLYSELGTMILHGTITTSSMSLNIASLPEGVYTIAIGDSHQKFVVIH